MKASHIHIAFIDLPGAIRWFREVLEIDPTEESSKSAIFRFGELDLVLDSDWGLGDTSMTFAIQSGNCLDDYEKAIRNGARGRTPPRNKGIVIGADVFGPGKLVIEFEQIKK